MKEPDFWRQDGGLLAKLLSPLGWVYGMASQTRFNLKKPWKAPIPVLCIGNLVSGGAGKTPVALSLGARLNATMGPVHFLTRGYGGNAPGPLLVDLENHTSSLVGDEALLLAEQAPTWVSANRKAGAHMAAEAGAKVIIMDDGFQNPGLAKDVSLLVIDGGYGFGNGRVIPAGPLREPLAEGLARADALVMIGEDETGALDGLGRDIPPVLKARVIPGPEAAGVKDKDVVAFAGIGIPEKFFDSLRAIGCRLVAAHLFPDHYPYEDEDLDRLRAQAKVTDSVLVTTAKDLARMSEHQRDGIEVLTIDMEWDDETALEAILEPLKAHPLKDHGG